MRRAVPARNYARGYVAGRLPTAVVVYVPADFVVGVYPVAVERPVEPVHSEGVLPRGVYLVDARFEVPAIGIRNLRHRPPGGAGIGGEPRLVEGPDGISVKGVVLVHPVDGLCHEVVAGGYPSELQHYLVVAVEYLRIVREIERREQHGLAPVVLLDVEGVADVFLCQRVSEAPRPRVYKLPALEFRDLHGLREVYAVSDVHGRGVCGAPVVAAHWVRGEVPEVGYHGHEAAVFELPAHAYPAARKVGAVEPFVERQLPEIFVFYDIVVIFRSVIDRHFADFVVLDADKIFSLNAECRRDGKGRRREGQ